MLQEYNKDQDYMQLKIDQMFQQDEQQTHSNQHQKKIILIKNQKIDNFLKVHLEDLNQQQKKHLMTQLIKKNDEKTELQLKFVYSQFEKINFFSKFLNDLDQNQKIQLIKLIKYQKINKNNFLYNQGDPKDRMFIIITGKIFVFQNLQEPTFISQKDTINSKNFKIFSFKLKDKLKEKQLGQQYFEELSSRISSQFKDIKNKIKNLLYMKDLSEEILQIIFVLHNYRKQKFINIIYEDTQFGYQNLNQLEQSRFTTKLIAQDAQFAYIEQQDYISILKKFIPLQNSMVQSQLRNNQYFDIFNDNQLNIISQSVKIIDCKHNDLLIYEEIECHNLYLVVTGQIIASKKGLQVFSLIQGDLFGEETFLKDNQSQFTYQSNFTSQIIQISYNQLILNTQDNLLKQFISQIINSYLIKNKERLTLYFNMKNNQNLKKKINIQNEENIQKNLNYNKHFQLSNEIQKKHQEMKYKNNYYNNRRSLFQKFKPNFMQQNTEFLQKIQSPSKQTKKIDLNTAHQKLKKLVNIKTLNIKNSFEPNQQKVNVYDFNIDQPKVRVYSVQQSFPLKQNKFNNYTNNYINNYNNYIYDKNNDNHKVEDKSNQKILQSNSLHCKSLKLIY